MSGLRRIGLVTLLATTLSAEAGPSPTVQITIWQAASTLGGASYGTTGALIFERREVEVSAAGEARLSNVAGTADPASMQLRDLTDKTASITEQRFFAAARTPTEMIARRIGDQITVVTPKGDVTGVLRGVDERTLVLELGTGDARRVSVMRRDFALDVRLTGPANDKPGVVWKLATAKPGKHAIELSYRADGLAWTADYLAVLDEPGRLVDFSAWATIRNTTGATFDNAAITLVGGSPPPSAVPSTRPGAVPTKFALPNPVRLTAETVQLELFPPRLGSKARTVTAYEALPDASAENQDTPAIDCAANNATGLGGGAAHVALEVDVPQAALPDGRVRLFRKRGTRLDVVGEDELRVGGGVARIKLSAGTDVTGERRALTCTVDERAHTIHEKLEVKVENKGVQPVDVVVREFLWRWPVWRVEAESVKGTRAGAQTQEYRVRVNAKATQTLTYTAVYTW